MLGQEPDIQWRVVHASEALTVIAYEQSWLGSVIADIEWCDAIIWNTPVYRMLVPWQLIRFLTLVREAGGTGAFEGKYATSMMTCFQYHDRLAEDWLRGTSEDLGMCFVEGRTADNTDMLGEEHRASMRFFMHEFVRACREHLTVERKFMPLSSTGSPEFTPGRLGVADSRAGEGGGAGTPRTVLLTDEYGKDRNLSRMIDVFIDPYPHPVEVVDINEFPYESGCHGCLRCEFVGDCDRTDGFQDFYQNLVETCDVLVFGMNIEGRYLTPVWKLFLDRTFSNGHRTSMMGKHTAYLIAGPLRSLPGVRQFLEGKDNVGRENSMCTIGDEYEDSAMLEDLLGDSAGRLARATAAKYQKSVEFLGLGGLKIFRDLIYGRGVLSGTTTASIRPTASTTFPRRTSGGSSSTLAWAWCSR